ncbi:TonB-dependent receptor domain-containing protein [Winogradskyella sp. UBA3174]|uniref:TonB-dependent receptor domain-containing protein n=1 Tax=Winogradskyella sp. UBA3174 TaxID=1947785 RepID=UPI0025F2D021|nr:TonB-dependent receptor [Winogradskyella sp. UBA3174]
MNKKLRCLILFLLVTTFCSLAYCQNKKEVQPLGKILLNLEKRYNVKFSFEPKTIEGLTTNTLYPELSLKQALQQLRLITNLNFKILSNRFIAITKSDELTENVQQLDEVVINNYLTKGLSKTVNGAVTINTNSFTILPGLIEPDVLQIIQKLPGVTSVDERISNINVRGGTNDQNLILYEGIRMYQSGHFFGLISAFNPYLSEEVNVSKNGTSSKYGDGVSSIISIKNSDVIDNKHKSGVGFNLLSADGYAKIPLSKKTELQLSARRSFTDILVSKTYDSYFDRIFRDSELNATNDLNTLLSLDERFLFYDFNAKFLYDINETSKLRVNILNIYNSLDYNQIFTTSDNNLQESRSALDQVSYGASINYSKVWNTDLVTSVEAYYSNYNLDANNFDVTNNTRLEQTNEVADYGLRVDITKTIDASTKINSGYQFNEVGVSNLEDVTNPIFTSFKKEIIRTHAVFSEVEWKSDSRNTYLRFGARINYFEKLSEILMEPRLTFNQKILDRFRLEILGELKSQSITQIIDLQQDFFGIEKRRWQLANNENVPLIKSQQASIGISYNYNGLLISAEGYYKNVSEITARSQGFQNQFQFTNDIGSYNIRGIDFLINKSFNQFSSWLSYTYSKNQYQFENLNSGDAFANTLDLTHVVNTSFMYSRDKFKIGIGMNWHSGRPFTKPSAVQNTTNSDIEYDAPNSSRLTDYFRTDISATYNFKLSKGIDVEAGASIWNILNQTNIINRFYTTDSDDAIIEINNRSLKFTPNFSLRFNF